MGKGDKKSRKGKIIMGTYGVNRPRKKRHNYRFVPRPKKESILSVIEPAPVEHLTAAEQLVASMEPVEKTVKAKKKTAAKTPKEKTSKKKEE